MRLILQIAILEEGIIGWLHEKAEGSM